MVLICLNLIFLLNYNYVRKAFSASAVLHFKYIFYGGFFLLLSSLCLLNYKIMVRLIKFYREEIRLIRNIGSDRTMGKLPVVAAQLMINLAAAAGAYGLSCLVHKFIYGSYFSSGRLSLILVIILLLPGICISLPVNFYIFKAGI